MQTPDARRTASTSTATASVAPSWESLVDRQIREAMEAGKFDDLPHQGAPLPIEDDSAAGEWALAFRMLRNAGVAPPWIEADKEARALLARRDAILVRGPPAHAAAVRPAPARARGRGRRGERRHRPPQRGGTHGRASTASRWSSPRSWRGSRRPAARERARHVPAEEPAIEVREATPADAEAVREIAAVAWRATYAGQLDAESIERFIAAAYTPERVALRIERHVVLVAGAPDGPVEAFVELAEHDDHVQLVAFYAHPDARGRGLGSALLARVRELHPGRGPRGRRAGRERAGEPFYAARGFEPGELLMDEVAGRADPRAPLVAARGVDPGHAVLTIDITALLRASDDHRRARIARRHGLHPDHRYDAIEAATRR